MLDNATNISVYVDSVNDLLGSTEGETTVLPNCTTEEIEETVAFYLTVATNETCVYDSSICAYDVHVNADCDSPCGRLIQRLGFDVPRCYFDHINHRERLSDSYYQCDWIVFPENISTSFHYSEILNATRNTSNRCDPNFDSTVSSSDDVLGGSHDDSIASKSYQTFILSITALVALVLAV